MSPGPLPLPGVQPAQHEGFVRVEPFERTPCADPDRLYLLVQPSVQPRVDNGGMDIAATADGARVAQPGGDAIEHRVERHRLCPLRAGQRFVREFRDGEDGGAPGAEMLRGELRPDRLANVVVDVVRADFASRADVDLKERTRLLDSLPLNVTPVILVFFDSSASASISIPDFGIVPYIVAL